MKYEIIQPPFTLQFHEMSKTELKEYFKWFQSIQPERLKQLTSAVTHTSGFEIWTPDFTPASLELLGEWFALHAETRNRTEGELEEITDRLTFSIEVSDEELTNRTFSLAMDIGMYVSQVFLQNHSSIHWAQDFGSKKNADYGQPILTGFGRVPFNPITIAITLARCLVDKTRSGKRLRELYDIWSNLVS